MQFKNIFLAASAFAGALAVQFTNSNFDLTAGQAFTLTWSDAEGPVTVLLKDGASTDLKTVQTLGSGLTGNSLVFTPPASLTTDFYAFEIQDSNNVPNYSQQFLIYGATGSPSSAASSSAAASSTATSTVTAISTSSALSSSAAVSSSSTGSSSAASSTTATDSSSTGSTTTTGSSSSSTTESASKSNSKFIHFQYIRNVTNIYTGTTLSTTHSKTSASNTASGTTSPATTAPTSSAAGLSSPLAFVFLALAAIVMLN
ncbi:extracellular matrix protein [Rutstroemia sp. NJR-2017a BVV2]|nr:extracellular matrix protein [Rutstroemia sp. NJR-2017a BVV2]